MSMEWDENMERETNTLVLFIGIPASGKTSFYRERFFPSHLYVSLDQVRSRSMERALFDLILERNKSCVVDNTNVRRSDRARYIPTARAKGYRVVGYFFDPDLKGCLERNGKRTGRAFVPERAIRAMLSSFERPGFEEGFDELYHVRLTADGFIVEKENETKQSE